MSARMDCDALLDLLLGHKLLALGIPLGGGVYTARNYYR